MLAALPAILAPGGRACVIAYHSLEDRAVKQAFRALAPLGRSVEPPAFTLLTKKPERPGAEELQRNPRSRSARLRAMPAPPEKGEKKMPRALPREWCGSEIANGGVHREKSRLSRGAMTVWALATSVLLGSLLLYVTQGIQVIRMGYEIDRIQNRFREVKAERERLEVELASLQDLSTVQREAVERLGMVFPEAGQVVVVRAGAGTPVAPAGVAGADDGADHGTAGLARRRPAWSGSCAGR